MKVILAEVLGYCVGVRRAMECAQSALAQYKGRTVFSLGPLIHNRAALESLEKSGLKILDEKNSAAIPEESAVIIRAHGVSPAVLRQLEQKKCVIINATCPRVVASQKTAAKYAARNFSVVLAGDKNHGEVAGIAGFAGKLFSLVQNNDDAAEYVRHADRKQRTVLLSQTTFSPSEFEKIARTILAGLPETKVIHTICPATKERQDALLQLCPLVDGVIVVGGKNSANTKRLLQTAAAHCSAAVLIENEYEIPDTFFSMETVGITAGASTPDSVICAVQKRLLDGLEKTPAVRYEKRDTL